MTYKMAKELADRLVDKATSMEFLTNWLMSEGAASLRPIEIALVALAVGDRMRGGWIGETRANPEEWYYAVSRMVDATTPLRETP